MIDLRILRLDSPIQSALADAFVSLGSSWTTRPETLRIETEKTIGAYRVDFALTVLDAGHATIARLVVEADGAGFHDATADAIRDAWLRSEGWDVARYTGSRIHRSASECANDALERLSMLCWRPTVAVAPPTQVEPTLPDIECATVGVLLDQPTLLESHRAEEIADLLSTDGLGTVVRSIARSIAVRGSVSGAALFEEAPESVRPWLAGRFARHEVDAAGAGAYLASCLSTLRRDASKRRRDDVERRARAAAKTGDVESLTRLTRELAVLAAGGC